MASVRLVASLLTLAVSLEVYGGLCSYKQLDVTCLDLDRIDNAYGASPSWSRLKYRVAPASIEA